MNILVIGCDQVGAALVRDLERIGHDISLVEKDPEQLKRLDGFDDYAFGGAALVGRSLQNCHNAHSNEMIQKVVDWFAASPEHNIVYTYHNEKENKDVYMVALRDDAGKLIGYYEKHEYRNRETMKIYDLA